LPTSGSSWGVGSRAAPFLFLEQAARRPHTEALSSGNESRSSILGGPPLTDVEDKEGGPDSSQPTLTNHLLIAMPSLADPNFSQTVALICEHSDKGALAIVLNKPLPMKLSDVLSQMKLEPTNDSIAELPVLRGGPVNTDRGFVLHRPGGKWDHTHKVSETIQVTTSRDVLAAMAQGNGPSDAFIALGYAGWEAGQLEREMRENAWLTMPVDASLVFDLPFEDRWHGAWRLMGIDVERMSLVAGHA
jgi:putative transcriptional regulator